MRNESKLPEMFLIRRNRVHGGVLAGIYFHSMSLKKAVKRGAMPPLAVFNVFMACGYDDVAHDNGYLEIDERNFEGAILEWEPFALQHDEYDALLEYIRASGTPVEVKDFGVSSYGEWFTKCYAGK